VLILDEPTIGLDPNQMREVRILIRELGKDRTVLLSTHILSEVEKVCNRLVIVSQGKIVATGTPAQISERLMKTGRLHVQVRGDGRLIKEMLDQVPGVASTVWEQRGDLNTYLIDSKGAEVMAEIVRLAAAKNWDVLELGPEKLSLEDVFTLVTDGTRLVRQEREVARG
jgi:ABC-2 type transport system ATP-binding protein